MRCFISCCKNSFTIPNESSLGVASKYNAPRRKWLVESVTKNWLLVPVFVIGILVLGSLTGLLSKKIKTVQRSINRETNKMSGVITESLRNIELVKSLGLTFPEIRRLKNQTRKIYDLEMMKTRRVRTLSFLQGTTLNLLRQSILFTLMCSTRFRKIFVLFTKLSKGVCQLCATELIDARCKIYSGRKEVRT